MEKINFLNMTLRTLYALIIALIFEVYVQHQSQ